MEIQLDNTTQSIVDLSRYIIQNEYLLPDPLSHHTDINTYCSKLLLFGKVFAITDQSNNTAGIVAGYMNDQSNKRAYVQLILVNKSFQARGIGTSLLTRFMDEAYNNGMRTVQLTCDLINKTAIKFYNRLGFNQSTKIHQNPAKIIMELKL